MKGRLSRALWLLVVMDAVAFFGVFLLAFYGGQQAHSAANIADLSGLNKWVWGGVVLCLAASFATWIVIANRGGAPGKQLAAFSQKPSPRDIRGQAEQDGTHHFGFIGGDPT